MQIKTAKLNNGLTVLALDKGQYAGWAVTYANYTQAEKRIAKLMAGGISAHVWGHGHAKYIVIDAQPTEGNEHGHYRGTTL